MQHPITFTVSVTPGLSSMSAEVHYKTCKYKPPYVKLQLYDNCTIRIMYTHTFRHILQ